MSCLFSRCIHGFQCGFMTGRGSTACVVLWDGYMGQMSGQGVGRRQRVDRGLIVMNSDIGCADGFSSGMFGIL